MHTNPILAEADRCVKCGYCLPHCPTYQISHNEGESPRGRIALLQALASGALDTPRLNTHLDHCLACRACERVCPSGVRYGTLIIAGRSLQRQRGSAARRWISTRLAGLVAGAPSFPVLLRLVQIYRDSPLRWLVRRFAPKPLALMDGLLPEGRLGFLPSGEHRPSGREPVARVGLFTGCVGQLADRPTLEAAIRLLVRMGVEVRVPAEQVCCGALHHHAGMEGESCVRMERNRVAFGEGALDAVVAVSSGCGAHLAEHGALPAEFVEISRYLERLSWPEGLQLRPLELRVLLHTPCSLRLLAGGDAPLQLLKRIPGLKVEALDDHGLCCGGAGGYLLTQPQIAEQLRAPHLEAVAASGAELLLTSNSGCRLHLTAGIRAAGLKVEVMHPVELLARQIAD